MSVIRKQINFDTDLSVNSINVNTLDNIVSFSSTTSSTSSTTGAMRVNGGLGVLQNLNIGGNAAVTGNSSLTGTLGVTGTTTLGDLSVGGNAAVTGNSSLTGTLDVTGETTLSDLTVNNSIEIDGIFNILPTTVASSEAPFVFSNTTQSTSTSTGSLTASGGMGVAKNLNVGENTTLSGTLDVSGTATLANLDVGTSSQFDGTFNILSTASPSCGASFNIFNATESTSTSTGALTTSGGVGIAKNLNVAGNTVLTGTLGVTGDATFGNITSSGTFSGSDLGVTGTATLANLDVGTSSQFDGTFNILSTASPSCGASFNIFNATNSTSKITGALTVSGGVGISGNLFASAGTLDSLNILNTTASTSKFTGALTVAGGVGILGSLFATSCELNSLIVTNGASINGTLFATSCELNSLNILNTTASTSKSTGALTVSGGVGISGDVYGTLGNFDNLRAISGTASTSKTTGALRVTGGIGASGSIYGASGVLDNLQVLDGTGSTSKSTGALRVTNGGLGVSGSIYGSRLVAEDGRFLADANGFDIGNFSAVCAGPMAFTGISGTRNIITFNNDATFNNPTLTNRSHGSRILFRTNISGSTLDTGYGIGTNTLWASTSTTSDRYNFYIGETSYRASIGANSVGATSNTYGSDVGSLNVKGHLVMDFSGGTSNQIFWTNNASGVAKPTFTNRSIGSKLVLFPNISGSTLDYACGIETGAMWYSVPSATDVMRYYFGSTTHSIELGPTSTYNKMVVSNTESSTSPTTGALRVTGGMFAGENSMFAKNLIVGKTNTTGVQNYTLYVNTPSATSTVGGYGFLNGAGTTGFFGAGGTNPYCAYFDSRIVISGEINVISDRRSKKNITNIDDNDALSLLTRIQPTKFNTVRESSEDMKHYGFIAQDVREIFPELVSNTIMELENREEISLELDKDYSFVLDEKYMEDDLNSRFTMEIAGRTEKIECTLEKGRIYVNPEYRKFFNRTKSFKITQMFLNEFLNVNYTGFIPILVSAVKTLGARVSELERLINIRDMRGRV